MIRILLAVCICVLLGQTVSAQTRVAPVTGKSTEMKGEETATTEDAKTKCPAFKELLYFGVSDSTTNGEVTRLQKYLRDFPSLYPSGLVTGEYSEETELAVRRLQKKFNIVKPGLSCKTGYGIVEEKTRAYINKNQSCEPIIPRKLVSCTNVPDCPVIANVIARGSVDAQGVLGDVATLQCFLAREGTLSTSLITGAFGPSTERALLSWQRTKGLTQSGTTNGATRDRIAKCGGANAGSERKSERYSFFIKPASGSAPLTIGLSFAVNGTTCTSYEISWGDGTAPEAFDAGKPATCTAKAITLYIPHVYTKPGIYTVTLKQGQNVLSKLPVINQAQITVR